MLTMPSQKISIDKLKSGGIEEYCYLNQFLIEDGDFDINDIENNAKVRIGLRDAYGIWQLSDCVGAVWLDKDKQVPIVVSPKIKDVDAVEMYLRLAENPVLFNSYQNVFECYPEEPAIEGVSFRGVTLLQIAVFLRELSQFCKRDLRQGFVRVRQNLVGKVKGKILTNDNLRLNTLHARQDRVACQFQILSLDTPANRILKAALMCCYRYLNRPETIQYPTLVRWARQCHAALSEVEDAAINESDFRGIVYSGLMRKYKTPHLYARMILKRLRTDASGEVRENQTVPYVLKMNQLFEGYVGVLLAKTGLDFIKQKSNLLLTGINFNIEFRPDYHAISDSTGGIVVDAKYKAIFDSQEKQDVNDKLELTGLNTIIPNAKPSNADIYQVVAYCSLLTEMLSTKHKSITFNKAALAVPTTSNEIYSTWEEWAKNSPILKLDESNIQIYILPCPVPILKK